MKQAGEAFGVSRETEEKLRAYMALLIAGTPESTWSPTRSPTACGGGMSSI
ncbi:hypothetical protein ACFQY5_15985 [Paeniroseomonas aquatica]|uniref:hypothetical protein n=1 Tax=Paeniroseomonas aquatica TaxID=373043 RepID=UPI003613A110